MRVHRIAELVDDLKAGIDRRIKPERVVGIFKVVVDGTGNTDGRDPVVLRQTLRPTERTVAADDDQPSMPRRSKVATACF